MGSRYFLAGVALIGLLFPIISPALASDGGLTNVMFYKTPTVNGVISAGEYPPPINLTSNVKAYMMYDSSFFYVAVSVTDATDNGKNDNFTMYVDPYYLRSTALRVSHWMISVRRDGGVLFYRGVGGWHLDPNGVPACITVKMTPSTNSWVVEMKIDLSASIFDIPPGTNRTLGMLLRVNDGNTLLFERPSGADRDVPSTWGTVLSTSLWAPVDLAVVGVTYSPREVIVGRTTRITIVFRNAGPAPISNIRVNLTVNGVSLGGRDYLAKIEANKTGSVSFDWIAGDGTFDFVATVGLIDGLFELNPSNNEGGLTLTPDTLSLSIQAPDGVSITVGGQTRESTGSLIVFLLPWGNVTVSAAGSVEFPGTRLVFKEWRPIGSTTPSITYNLTGPTTLEATYDNYFQCYFNFKDKANRVLQGVSFRLRFPNSTTQNFTGPSHVWMPAGVSSLTGAYVGGLNVLESSQTMTVESPLDLTCYLNLRDVTLRVADIFGLPVGGAALSVTFLNGTTYSLDTPGDGIVTIAKVPLGKLNATVQFLSFTTQAQIDASVAQEEWRVTVVLSYAVIGVLAGVPLLFILVIGALILRSRLKL